MFKKLKCQSCGHEALTEDDYANNTCVICGKNMKAVDETFSSPPQRSKNNLSSELIFMKKELKECGHKGLWIMIEAIKDPKERLKQRKSFFLIGGKLPPPTEIRR